MSIQSKTMPTLDLQVYVRVVAAVFTISSAVAFVLTLLRLLYPELYYLDMLDSSNLIIHYVLSGHMLVTSVIGFLNSCIVLKRRAEQNCGKNITTWLLFHSLFETSRVIYVFVTEVMLKGKGVLQIYELVVSAVLYLLDSYLYCQMILRH